jgi:hypothetical protein
MAAARGLILADTKIREGFGLVVSFDRSSILVPGRCFGLLADAV